MYKLITSTRDTDDLSIGFNRDRIRRQRELSINKSVRGNYLARISLKIVFGFAEHQEKGTYGLGYKLTLTRKNQSSVLNKANATNKAKIDVNGIEWYLPQYTPSMEQQKIVCKQI